MAFTLAAEGGAGPSYARPEDFHLLEAAAAACEGEDGEEEMRSRPSQRRALAPGSRRPRTMAAAAALGAAAAVVFMLVVLGRGSGSGARGPQGATETVDWLDGVWPSQAWTSSFDEEGFCLANPGPATCTMQRNPQNENTVRLSLFGNSYSGFYFWAEYSLKHVIEGVKPVEWSAANLTEQEINLKVSMHTLFNSGLAHHVDSFRSILLAEDPDYVALQDGSLIAMGWKGGMNSDGSTFKVSPQARRTAKAMQFTYGKAIWEWASKREQKNGRKLVVFLIAAWARPEEAFVRASAGQDAELEDRVDGSWAMKNYEVYREGVTPSLKSQHFIDVHHEGEMLHATLEGLGIYRERIFKGAAAMAGRKDGPEFRRSCPFEVSIVPVGVAFHDVRTRVEDIFRARPVPDTWWPTAGRSSWVQFGPNDTAHKDISQKERKSWFGAKETNLLFTDIQQDMPWFGHPTPAGTFLYGIMVKRTLLAVMQGRDGVKDGRSMGQQVQLRWDDGVAKDINNLLIEEANHFDIEAFNEEWKTRGAAVCDEAPWVCPGGGVHMPGTSTSTGTSTTTAMPTSTGTETVSSTSTTSTPAFRTTSAAEAGMPGFRTTGVFEIGRWLEQPSCAKDFADCRSSHVCCGADSKCYEKNDGWAACLPSCEKGVHEQDDEEFQTPWTCRVLAQKVENGEAAPDKSSSSASTSASEAGDVASLSKVASGLQGMDDEMLEAKKFAETAVDERKGLVRREPAEETVELTDARMV